MNKVQINRLNLKKIISILISEFRAKLWKEPRGLYFNLYIYS